MSFTNSLIHQTFIECRFVSGTVLDVRGRTNGKGRHNRDCCALRNEVLPSPGAVGDAKKMRMEILRVILAF